MGASALESELLGEKAFSLGLAAQLIQKSLEDARTFTGPEAERRKALQDAADYVQAYFVQREMLGFTNHDHPIEYYDISAEVLNKVGVK